MSIRSTSYYGWENILEDAPTASRTSAAYNAIAVDSSGSLYIVGSETLVGMGSNWIVKKSVDSGKTFFTVDYINRDNNTDIAYNIVIDSSDNVYVVGLETVSDESANWIVRKSTTGASGSFSYIDSLNRENSHDRAYAIAIDSSSNIYVVGHESDGSGFSNWIVRKSTTGASGSFVYIDSVDRSGASNDAATSIVIDSSDDIYIVGYEGVTSKGANWIVRKSTTGASGSFVYIDSVDRNNSDDRAFAIAIDSSDNLYVVGSETVSGEGINWVVRKSTTGASGSFSYIDSANRDDGTDQALGIDIDSNDSVYVVGEITVTGEGTNWAVRRSAAGASGSFSFVDDINRINTNDSATATLFDAEDNIYVAGNLSTVGIIRKGKLTSNSASLGPRMLTPSFGYVFSEISGTVDERFKLNNISEFPHSSGIFQMKNIILGTTDSGQIGKTDDSILQINYFGSVVYVMWPKQAQQNIPVAGFGDFSLGQRSGKLTTAYEPGEFVDVTEFDHATFYCYLLKDTSGTLDEIDIIVERRPLQSTPFAVDQSIEYTTSGSATIASLKDIHYRKEINYGDLSIKEIGYPIDVPLTNVRELRISAKHMNGQSAEKNRNYIVWSRFIKSDQET